MKKKITGILLAAVMIMGLLSASGIAVFAEGPETPIVPPDSGVGINGLNLILSGEIGLTYHVYVPKKYRDGRMELRFRDREPVVTDIDYCPQDDDYRYTATCYLSAIELSEPVTLTVYDKGAIPLPEDPARRRITPFCSLRTKGRSVGKRMLSGRSSITATMRSLPVPRQTTGPSDGNMPEQRRFPRRRRIRRCLTGTAAGGRIPPRMPAAFRCSCVSITGSASFCISPPTGSRP